MLNRNTRIGTSIESTKSGLVQNDFLRITQRLGPSNLCLLFQDGLSSGHASDLDEEAEAHPSALIPGQAPPNLTKRQVSSSRDSYIQQLEQLNMRNMEHTREVETQRTKTNGQQQQHLLTNILAMESISSRLPPPSPAPEAPGPDQGHNVAAAIKDIRKAIQSTKTLQTQNVVNVTPNITGMGDPWLPRAGERLVTSELAPVDRLDQPPPPPPAPLPPPPPLSSCPPSPACSTPPPPPPVELQEESESEVEEERVPTPDIMKKEDEDLDTDQVIKRDFIFTFLPPFIISNSRLSSSFIPLAGIVKYDIILEVSILFSSSSPSHLAPITILSHHCSHSTHCGGSNPLHMKTQHSLKPKERMQSNSSLFQETDRLLGQQYSDDNGYFDSSKVRHHREVWGQCLHKT